MTAPGPPIPYNSTRLILVSQLSALALGTITCSDPLSGSAPTPVPTPNPTPGPVGVPFASGVRAIWP